MGEWQEKRDACLSCHSWLDSYNHSVTAVIVLLASALLAAVAIAASVRSLFTDGYRRLPTDRNRLP